MPDNNPRAEILSMNEINQSSGGRNQVRLTYQMCVCVLHLNGEVKWSITGKKDSGVSRCTPEHLCRFLIDECQWPQDQAFQIFRQSLDSYLVVDQGFVYLTPTSATALYRIVLEDDIESGCGTKCIRFLERIKRGGWRFA